MANGPRSFLNAAPEIVPESVLDARSERMAGRLAYPVLFLFFVPLFVLILKDQRALSWDEAFYGEYSIGLFYILRHSPIKWPAAMVNALGDRAPAIAWLGQFFAPLAHFLPSPQTALLCFTLATQMAVVMLLYQVLRKVFATTLAALVTCGIIASGSLFTGLTYRYFVEPLQTLGVVCVAALAAYNERFGRPMLFLLTLAAVAFGLLVKTSSPLYQLPFVLYLAYVFFFRKDSATERARTINSLPWLYVTGATTALLLGVTISWYAANYAATTQHAIEAASGSLSIYYGKKASLLSKFVWWSGQFQKNFLWLPLLIVLVATAPRAVVRRWQQNLGNTRGDILCAVSGLWILVVLLLFARSINEDVRYLLALIPCAAFLICWLASNLKSRKLLVGMAAVAAAQFIITTAQSWGAIAPMEGLSTYLRPYVKDDLALRDSMFGAINTRDASPEHPAIVGEELEEFNAVGLSFYSVVLGRPLVRGWSYSGLNFVKADPAKEWARIQKSGCKYYIYRKYPSVSDGDVFNHLAKAMLAKVVSDPGFSFRADKSNDRVLLFERVLGGPRYTGLPGGTGVSPTPAGFSGIGSLAKLPFGLMEFPRMGALEEGEGTIPIVGWAASPQGIAQLQVLVDGQHLANAAKNARPDVVKAYPRMKSAGFRADLDLAFLPDGIHRISVIAVGQDGSSRPLSDIPVITHYNLRRAGPKGKLPFGLLEFPRADFFFEGNEPLPVTGWTVSPTGVKRVEILLDGKHLEDALPNSRPDVVKAYPGLASTGFAATVGPSGIAVGAHQIAVVAYGQDGSSRVLARTSVTRR
jgi:hypothetical protein